MNEQMNEAIHATEAVTLINEPMSRDTASYSVNGSQ